MNSVSGPISRCSSFWSIELLGGDGRPRRGRESTGFGSALGERGEVVGAAAHGIEQRVVGLVELALRGRRAAVSSRSDDGGEAAGGVHLRCALVGAPHLLVVGGPGDAEDGVERGLSVGTAAGTPAVAPASRSRAPRRAARCARRCARALDAGLSTRSGLLRRTVSQTVSSCSMCPSSSRCDAVVAARQVAHLACRARGPSAPGSGSRRADAQAAGLVPRELGERAVHPRERAHELDGRGQGRRARASARSTRPRREACRRRARAAACGRTRRARSGRSSRSRGARARSPRWRCPRRASGRPAKSPCPGPTSTTRYSAGSARSRASQRAFLPRGAPAVCRRRRGSRGAGAAQGRWSRGAREAKASLTPGASERPPSSEAAPRRRTPKCAVDVRPRRVGVDEDDGPPELREVDRQVRRDDALPHAPPSTADGDDLLRARSARRGAFGDVGLGERHA